MSAPLYRVDTGATAITIPAALTTAIGIQAGADFGLALKKIHIGFNGVTAANPPITVRLFSATYATNPPGTNSTSSTPIQVNGRTLAATNMLGGTLWTAEPTVKTYIDSWPLTPNGGTVLYDLPLGDEPDTPALGSGFGIELTPGQSVGFIGTLWVTRI
jgi:hypothetical protein